MKKSVLFFYCSFLLLLAFPFSCTREAPSQSSEKQEVITSDSEGGLVTLRSGAVVEKINGDIIYLGDILLSEEECKRLDETGSMFKEDDYVKPLKEEGFPVYPLTGMTVYLPSLRAVGVHSSQNKFWAMLRFRFSSALQSWQVYAIKRAITYMESITNVRFFDATNEPTIDPTYGFPYPYVEFTPANVNNSYVGRQGGKQIINLCDYNQGTIVHEICHALGMFHEQSRANRDNYIRVHYENIDPENRHNFNRESNNYHMIGWDFDFNSVMLYGSYAFSKNNQPTMTKMDGSTFSGHGEFLSEDDRKFLNTFYLPFKARKDICAELDAVVYDANNVPLSEEARIRLERTLNEGRCEYPLPK